MAAAGAGRRSRPHRPACPAGAAEAPRAPVLRGSSSGGGGGSRRRGSVHTPWEGAAEGPRLREKKDRLQRGLRRILAAHKLRSCENARGFPPAPKAPPGLGARAQNGGSCSGPGRGVAPGAACFRLPRAAPLHSPRPRGKWALQPRGAGSPPPSTPRAASAASPLPSEAPNRTGQTASLRERARVPVAEGSALPVPTKTGPTPHHAFGGGGGWSSSPVPPGSLVSRIPGGFPVSLLQPVNRCPRTGLARRFQEG